MFSFFIPLHWQKSLKNLEDTGWVFVCWALYPKYYSSIHYLYLVCFQKERKAIMPSGSFKPSQGHTSSQATENGNFPGCCFHCPSCYHDSHKCGHLLLRSHLSHPQSPSLLFPPAFPCWVQWVSHQLALAFRCLSRNKGNIIVLSDELKNSHPQVPEIEIMIITINSH